MSKKTIRIIACVIGLLMLLSMLPLGLHSHAEEPAEAVSEELPEEIAADGVLAEENAPEESIAPQEIPEESIAGEDNPVEEEVTSGEETEAVSVEEDEVSEEKEADKATLADDESQPENEADGEAFTEDEENEDAAAGQDVGTKNGLWRDEDGIYRYYENGRFVQINGFVRYQGGLFYVRDGYLFNANGLVQDPGHADIWYFCSNGQAQLQYSGLAEYNGEWFYLSEGKLNTTRVGLVSYNGGRFIIAAGRILREVNGLIQDPNTGLWYYVAAGQVADYTGLALYDNAWFYVIDGQLAVNYTGMVTYNGAEFYVVNGMVQNPVQPDPKPEPVDPVEIWDPDIVFTSVDTKGNQYTDAVFKEAKLTMLNFWAYWCGPCTSEMPDLQSLSQNYASKGLQIFGVSMEQYESGNISVINRLGITYPTLRMTDSMLTYLDSGYVPTTIFVDSTGKVVGEQYVGSRSYASWASIVDSLLR